MSILTVGLIPIRSGRGRCGMIQNLGWNREITEETYHRPLPRRPRRSRLDACFGAGV